MKAKCHEGEGRYYYGMAYEDGASTTRDEGEDMHIAGALYAWTDEDSRDDWVAGGYSRPVPRDWGEHRRAVTRLPYGWQWHEATCGVHGHDANPDCGVCADLASRVAEADATAEEIEERTWDAAEWLSGLGGGRAQCRELGITAATTDAELDAVEARLTAEAEHDDVILRDLGDALAALRDGAIEEMRDVA